VEDEMGGHVARIRQTRNANKIPVWKPEGEKYVKTQM